MIVKDFKREFYDSIQHQVRFIILNSIISHLEIGRVVTVSKK